MTQQTPAEHLETARKRLREELKDADLDVIERDAVNSALGHIALALEHGESSEEPTRSEPADFGGGDSTGVQDL